LGDGRSGVPGTNALDLDSAMLYTESLDETPYKSNRNVFSACHYHVVWCPKYCRRVLIPAIEERLKHIIYEVCEEYQAEVE
jgi:putative transposase